jgi:hypothetical protein
VGAHDAAAPPPVPFAGRPGAAPAMAPSKQYGSLTLIQANVAEEETYGNLQLK